MNFDYKRFPVTYLLAGISIVVYVYTSLRYSFNMSGYQGILAGGLNPVLVVYGHEFYRLLTANFIHFGIMHIFCNCYSLVNFGQVMERLLGSIRYTIVVIASGMTTTILPCLLYLFNGSGVSSVMGGISGVIFGLLGSLLALAIKFKNIYSYLFRQVASSLILMLLISFLIPSISLVGHLSGMIGGFVATWLIIKFMPLSIWQNNYYHYVN